MQARNAQQDMQTLQRMKEAALQDPEGFATAIAEGKVKTKNDPLFYPSGDDEDEDEDEKIEGMNGEAKEKKWEAVPAPQNIVRCPPINWDQYGIVGESLEKLHKDQLARPSEGVPQRMDSSGQFVPGGEGYRRVADLGIAAPYQPGRDKIEKLGTKKGGKR
jgi:hypothetical protein